MPHNASLTVLFLSHGGGPKPLFGEESHREMVDCLKDMTARIEKPSAIIVISAHWEEEGPSVTSSAKPELLYDYYGFPPESYEIQYPCPGYPQLAEQISTAFKQAGFESRLESERGLDHGVFVPLKLMYPEADIPCVEVSLLSSLDSEAHIDIGRALQSLDLENVLVIGSGFTFHNMKAFFAPETDDVKAMNEAFEQWLIDTCSNPEIGEQERRERLIHWERAPHARFSHPREEHLLPLHVCYGLAQRPADEVFDLKVLNKKSSMYLWRS